MSSAKRVFTAWCGNYWLSVFSLAGCAAFWIWLRTAPADAPRLLLDPVVWLVERLSDVRFGLLAGRGYCGFARDGTLLIIEKTCSGGKFLVILFSLLATAQLPRLPHRRRFAGLVLLLAYAVLTAIAVSALRIALSIALLGLAVGMGPVLLHNLTGIAAYLTAMPLCYAGAHRLVVQFLPERTVG